MKVTLLTGGGGDYYYELGLCSGLISNGIQVNYIGSDSVKDAEILKNVNVNFYNLRGSQDPYARNTDKILRVLRYYLRLIKYAAITDSKLFHLQWLNKFVYFDRIFLNLYYKMLGKKLIFTAHNVNAGIRDSTDGIMNRLSLKFMYNVVDHIIVHTEKMRHQLIKEFGVDGTKVAVLTYGINDMIFKSNLNRMQARRKLALEGSEKVAMFFGIITPYKGLEYLLSALAKERKRGNILRLIIAGKIDKNAEKYWDHIRTIVKEQNLGEYIIENIGFIPDKNVEVYFKAADVLILPYRYIFQSGLLFLAYSFGLPVIATDVGSLKEYIIKDGTGLVCKPEDPEDLAQKINLYFNSDIFINLDEYREKIKKFANKKYSWEKIGKETVFVYKSIQ